MEATLIDIYSMASWPCGQSFPREFSHLHNHRWTYMSCMCSWVFHTSSFVQPHFKQIFYHLLSGRSFCIKVGFSSMHWVWHHLKTLGKFIQGSGDGWIDGWDTINSFRTINTFPCEQSQHLKFPFHILGSLRPKCAQENCVDIDNGVRRGGCHWLGKRGHMTPPAIYDWSSDIRWPFLTSGAL